MTHAPSKWMIAALCLSISVIGCGNQEEPKHQATAPQSVAGPKPAERISYPQGDVRWHFVAKEKPLLDEGTQVRLWAGSREKDKPEILVKELDYPTLEYGPDGTLYFIGDKQDAIVAIKPDKTREVIARSGTTGGKTDDGEPVYNTFEGLSIADDGRLLTLKNGAYPFEINVKTGEMKFLGFVMPDGAQIKSVTDFDSVKNPSQWTFKKIYWVQGKVFLRTAPYFSREASSVVPGKWSSISNGALKPIDQNQLEPFLLVADQGGITGLDGYIYAVEEGKGKQDPDRVIRIGGPGLSSLRKDASRVTIATFTHGMLTGSIAFSPKGELAVGAKNAIYLITRSTANTTRPGNAP